MPSYISRGTPRAAKGAAASTSSQPQAVMDSSADTSAPLASRLAGGESLGGSCRNRLLEGACPQTKTTQTERQPTRTEAHRERVPPQAISGSEADSMSRGGYPVTGRPHRSRLPKGAGPSTKPSPPELHPTRTKAHRERVPPQAISGSEADSMSRGGYPVTGRPPSELSSIGHTPSNEAVLTRATPDRNQSAPGTGAPTGDFWERSGQHEPRRVPGHGAPSIEVVFHQTHAVSEAAPSVGSLLLLRRYGDGRRLPPQLPQHIPVRPRH